VRFYPEQETDFQLGQMLNNKLTLQDNMEGALMELSLDAGENTIGHGLGFVPTGYLVLYQQAEGNIYGARVADWTNENLFLVSSVANPRVRLFVL